MFTGVASVFENAFMGNTHEHLKINSSTNIFLNHSRNMCMKFEYSNSKTLGTLYWEKIDFKGLKTPI